MKLPPIVYLDTSFITDAYETFTGKPVPIKVVRSENLTGGFSAGLFHAGAATQEAKEFPLSSQAMYQAMERDLSKFPTVDLSATEPAELPDYFWAEGEFAVGSSQVRSGQEITSRDAYFRLYPKGAQKKGVYMLTNDVYFTAGYDQVLQHVHGASRGFGIQVKALVKLLALQDANFWPLCAPLVIEKLKTE